MGLIKFFKTLDRRVIFVVVALAAIIPLLVPIGLPVVATEPVQKIYDYLESLPAGSKILLSFDYDPQSMPEVQPMAISIIRHCFRKNIRMIMIALWPAGANLAQDAVDEARKDFPDKVYGKDYINLGYKTGGIIVMKKMGQSIPETFPVDFFKKDIKEYPIMDNVVTLNPKDIKLIVGFSAGDPGAKQWTMVAQAQFGVKVAGGCTAVSAPEFYPYLNTGQMLGLIGGMKGAAEYENLIKKPGMATRAMDAQSIIHLVIIAFIIIANIVYLSEKREEKRKNQEV